MPKAWLYYRKAQKDGKEINLVSSNGRKPKIDIRDWASEHEKMGKGITLNFEELKKLKEIINGMDLKTLRNKLG